MHINFIHPFVFVLTLILLFSAPAHAEKLTFTSPIDWTARTKEQYPRMHKALTEGDFKTLDEMYNGKQQAFERDEIDEDVLNKDFEEFSGFYAHQPSHKHIEAWVAASPDSYAANLVAAEMYRNYGHDLRGSKFADETSKSQFAGMDTYFRKAAPFYIKSLTLAEKPVLSYAGILNMFFAPSVALETLAPAVKAPQTHGEVFGKAIGDLVGAIAGVRPSYSYEDLHKAMWHYLSQGLTDVPNSHLLAGTYFELITPKWFGSDEMMAGFAETQYKNGVIKKSMYQYLQARMLIEKNGRYFFKGSPDYDAQKSADLFYEATQYLDEYDNRITFYLYMMKYLLMSYDLYMDNSMTEEREKKLLPMLDFFIESDTNPYKVRNEESFSKEYTRILDIRAYVRMVRIKNGKGAWDDLNESFRRGSGYAGFKVASTYCEGYPGVVEKDQDKCRSIMKQAADMGDENAKRLAKQWGLD